MRENRTNCRICSHSVATWRASALRAWVVSSTKFSISRSFREKPSFIKRYTMSGISGLSEAHARTMRRIASLPCCLSNPVRTLCARVTVLSLVGSRLDMQVSPRRPWYASLLTRRSSEVDTCARYTRPTAAATPSKLGLQTRATPWEEEQQSSLSCSMMRA